MLYLYITLALVNLAALLGLFALLWWLQRDTRRRADEIRAAGRDPDVMFIGALGRLQAEEKGFRSPIRWIAVKYVQWTRRRMMR